MTEVREIKTSEADVNKPQPAVKEKSQSVRADPLVKLIEDTGQAKSDTRPGKQAKALKKKSDDQARREQIIKKWKTLSFFSYK